MAKKKRPSYSPLPPPPNNQPQTNHQNSSLPPSSGSGSGSHPLPINVAFSLKTGVPLPSHEAPVSSERLPTTTNPPTDENQEPEVDESSPSAPSVKEILGSTTISDGSETGSQNQFPENSPSATAEVEPPTTKSAWTDLFKGPSGVMKKKGTPFLLESGEICVKIPNEVIKRNKKRWESFVLGQFQGNLPSHGALQWDLEQKVKRHHCFQVELYLGPYSNSLPSYKKKSSGSSNVEHRRPIHVCCRLGARAKPIYAGTNLSSCLAGVPPHFFSEEGFEHVAGAIGHPVHLHPSTANMTNLEVAKVLTIINPLKPLPEVMNVQFESGETHRVEVSCPWLPPICAHCLAVGHSIRRCPTAPITCSVCKSTSHAEEACPRAKKKVEKTGKLEEYAEVVEVKHSSKRKSPERRKKDKEFASTSTSKEVVLTDKGVVISFPKPAAKGKRLQITDKGKDFASAAEKYLPKEKKISSKTHVEGSSSSSGAESSEAESSEESSSSDSESREEDNPADDSRFMAEVSKQLMRKKSGANRKSGSQGNLPKHPPHRAR